MSHPHPVPKSPLDLFCSFTLIALQGFGGVVAIVQGELVDKKQWLTLEEFIEEWAVAQILPGPNVVNLSLILGARYFGLRGALASLAGMLLLPSLIALMFAVFYGMYASHPGVAGSISGMSGVAAGLILATGLKMLSGLQSNPLGKTRCAVIGVACFVSIALLRWPLLPVLLVLGTLSGTMVYRRLKTRSGTVR